MFRKSVAWLLLATSAAGFPVASASAASSAAAVAAPAWGVVATDVPADPSIRFGRLANGMKYAIRVNATPRGAASVRLHFAFGSLAEADKERGLAHFIEHMAFNGTARVPEGEMKKILERQGLAFGPDTNALTGFDSTVYMLDLPKADEQRLDTAFFLLREVAGELRFDQSAIDRERAVVTSERRSRDGPQVRLMESSMAFHTPLTPYASRLPIGDEAALAAADASAMRALYRRYYRPENATLVIVGDFDPALVEAKIWAKFADWRGIGPAGPAMPRGRVALDRPTEVGTYVDPAMVPTVAISVMRPWEDPADTRDERFRNLLRALATTMLSRRFEEIALPADSPILGGMMVRSENKDAALRTSVSLTARDGQWTRALAIAEQEVRRALQHGFRQSELAVQLLDMEGGLKQAADQSDTRTNASLAQTIVGNVGENDNITTPQFRFDFFRQVKRQITLDAVDSEFRKLWQGSAPLVFVADKKPLPDKAQIAALFEQSRRVAVLPPKKEEQLRFAYGTFGPPGAVVADSRIADLGIRTIRFANNVRLNIKRTDFEKGTVRFEVRFAGGKLALPADKPGMADFIGSMSSVAGLDKHSLDEIKRMFAGHRVTTGISVDDDAFTSSGFTVPSDLALQMKLSAAFFTAPGYRPEADGQWKSLVPLFDSQVRSKPDTLGAMKLPAVLASGNPRFGVADAKVLASRNLGEVRAILPRMLANAPIEIGIVGDIDEAAAIKAVAESFGTLAPRPLNAPAFTAERQASFPSDLRPVTLKHDGQANQAMLALAWKTDDDKDYRRLTGLNLLAAVLELQVTDTLREELGDAYTPDVVAMSSPVFDRYGYLAVTAVVDPGKLDEAEKAVVDAVSTLARQPVGNDVLVRARNPILERIDRLERENAYWLTRVARAQSDPEGLERHRRRRQVYLAVTAAELRQLARDFLDPGKRLSVRIVSSKLETAASAGRPPQLP